MANSVRIAASIDDQVSKGLDKIRDRFGLMAADMTVGSAAGSLAAKGIEKGFDLAGQAIGRATEFVGDSIDAYRQEQVSIAGLNAALDANIKGWDGNTTAVESAIAAREQLAFADDEQREALKILVAATQDATQATDAQRVAMDLARFRGISLSQASDLVAKAWDGNVTSLKKLGISLDAGAKGYDALAGITKVAGGAAAKYADTDLGKVEAANIKVDNAMEQVGRTFSQIGAVVIPAAADAFANVASRIDYTTRGLEALGKQGTATAPVVDGLGALVDGLGQRFDAGAGALYEHLLPAIKEAEAATAAHAAAAEADARAQEVWRASLTDSSNAVEDGRNRIVAATGQISGSMKVGFVDSSMSAQLAFVASMDKVKGSIGDARDAIKGATDSIINDTWDPLINAAEITATKLRLADAQKEASTKGLTKTEKAEADLRVLNLKKSLDQLLADQAQYGSDSALLAYTDGKYTKEQVLAGLQSKNEDVRKHWEDYVVAQAAAHQASAAAAYTGGTNVGANLDTGIGAGIAGNKGAVTDPAADVINTMGGYRADGTPIGAAWVTSVAEGITKNDWKIDGAISKSVGSKMIGFSPPKEGPLKNIDVGGANIAKAWVDDFAGSIDAGSGRISGALSGIHGLLATAPPALSGGGGVMTGGGSVPFQLPPIHVYIDGREATRSTARWGHLTGGRSQGLPG